MSTKNEKSYTELFTTLSPLHHQIYNMVFTAALKYFNSTTGKRFLYDVLVGLIPVKTSKKGIQTASYWRRSTSSS